LTAPGGEPDEQRLVAAAQKDPACFGELYERHFVRVYAYVSRRVASRDAAEDVTSEVFHRALAGIGAYEWKGIPFAAWLFRIAAHAIADRGRRSGREHRGRRKAWHASSAHPPPATIAASRRREWRAGAIRSCAQAARCARRTRAPRCGSCSTRAPGDSTRQAAHCRRSPPRPAWVGAPVVRAM